MSKPPIPFNRFSPAGPEFGYVQQAIDGIHISGDGEFTRRCQGQLESGLGVARAMLTTSCTHALELAALLLDIQPGDEVIVPSFTFVSIPNAFALRGAKPVFADVRADTLNLDEALLPDLITPRTKAIVPVHYAGVGCEMDRIMEIADERGVAVVEDNAHGLFGKYKGRFLGTFGPMSALSFHETKNFTCGEGGALLFNDASLVERAEILREKGTNRKRYFRGEVDKYTWVDVGSSYLPSDLLAAFLHAQLEARDRIQQTRHRIWNHYQTELASWAKANGVGLPFIPQHCEHTAHIFYLIMPTLEARTRLIAALQKENILAVFHYQPLHLSEMGMKFGGRPGQCPVTESISDRLLRLPLFTGLTSEDLERIVETVMRFRT